MKNGNSSPEAKFRLPTADVNSFGRFHHLRRHLGLALAGFAGSKEFAQAWRAIAIPALVVDHRFIRADV